MKVCNYCQEELKDDQKIIEITTQWSDTPGSYHLECRNLQIKKRKKIRIYILIIVGTIFLITIIFMIVSF